MAGRRAPRAIRRYEYGREHQRSNDARNGRCRHDRPRRKPPQSCYDSGLLLGQPHALEGPLCSTPRLRHLLLGTPLRGTRLREPKDRGTEHSYLLRMVNRSTAATPNRGNAIPPSAGSDVGRAGPPAARAATRCCRA